MDGALSSKRGRRALGLVSPVAASLALLISALAIIGWATNALGIARISSDYVPMAPSTAICFVFLSFVVIIRGRYAGRRFTSVLRLLTWLVLVISAIILLEFVIESVSDAQPDIETLLVRESADLAGGFTLGRMSPLAAALLVLLALSIELSFLGKRGGKTGYQAGQVMAVTVIAAAVMLLVGYWYGAPLLYGGEVTPVALPTVAAFLLAGLAIVSETPGSWLNRWLASSSVAAQFSRLVIPPTVAAILFVGWLHQVTQFISTPFEFSLVALITALIITTLTVVMARRVQAAVDAGERSLREQKDFAESLVDSSTAWIWQTDTDFKHTFSNRFVSSCLGYDPKEFLTLDMFELVHPDDRDLMRVITRDAMSTGQTWSGKVLRWRHKDGSWRYIESSGVALFDEKGRFTGLQGVDFDVTARERSTAALMESEKRFSTFFRSSPIAIAVTSLDSNKLIDVNPAWEELTGFPRDEAVGRTAHDLDLWAAPADRSHLLEALRDGSRAQVDMHIRHKQGDIIDAIMIAEQVDLAGEPCMLSMAQDITERKRAEEALARKTNDLAALFESGKAFTTSLDLDVVLQTIVDSTIKMVDLDTAAVYLLKGDELYLGATTPPLPEHFPEDVRQAPLADHPHIKEAVSSREPVVMEDTAAEELSPAEQAVVEERGLRSIIYLPLLTENRVVGILILGTMGRVRAFHPDEIELFGAIAGQAALAVDNARLFDAAQREIEERTRAERALTESEERYRSIFADTPVAIWEEDFSDGRAYFNELSTSGVTDLRRFLDENPSEVMKLVSLLRVIDVNDAGVRAFKARDRDRLISDLPRYFTEESLGVFKEIAIALFKGEKSHRAEAPMQMPAGEQVNFEVTMTVQPGYEETLSRILVSFIDLTERRRSERVVAARARLFEFAANHTLDELHEEILNEAERQTGSTIGFFHFVDEDQRHLTLQQWSTRTKAEFCQAEGKRMHYDIDDAGVWVDCIREGGPVIHNDYAALPHKRGLPEGHAEVLRELVTPIQRGGRLVGVIGVGNKATDYDENDVVMVTLLADLAWDITQQKQAELALRESEARFRNIVDSSPMGMHMYELRQDGRLVFAGANPASDLILGVDNSRFVGMTIEEAFPPLAETEVPERYREAASKGTPWYTEQIDYSEGVISGAFEVYAFQTEPMKMVALFNDITQRLQSEEERERLRAQLAQAQKMESVGRLAGGVAHDFNNMLGVIMGHVEIARTHMEDTSDPLLEDLAEIHKAARRSADLTRQLLAFARRQATVPMVVRLEDTIEGMLSLLKRMIGEDIELSWEPRPDLWLVKIDPSQVDQLLANLLVNARDSIDGAGKVRLALENAVVDEDAASAIVGLEPGEYVKITVSDNGRGMEPEVVQHAFEPFFTTKSMAEGTGLGLATVYGIVKQNGGFVSIDSKPGAGTTFEIYLPRYSGGPEAGILAVETEVERGSGETILLVEDEPSVLRMTEAMLQRLGYTVIAAHGAAEALETARANSERIDLLLTDVVMPGMSGRELAEEIAAVAPGAAHLFMSGYTADVISDHGVIDDGVGFLQKPFTAQKLAARVWEALDRKRG